MTMTSRERLAAALNHRQPDRIPVDFNGTAVTGMHVKCVIGLREHYGLEKRLVKVHEPYQMLGWIDDDLQAALGIDVEGVYGPETMFGFRNENWKPWRMDDGTEVLVSGNFRTTKDANGDTLVYPEGDRSAPPSGRLPKNGFFFDTIIRQDPIDEAKLDPADNLEEFGPIAEATLDHFETESRRAAATGRGIIASFGGTALGDIALVPAPGPQAPEGHPRRRGMVRLDPDPPALRPQGLRAPDRDRPREPRKDPRPGRRPGPGRLRLRHGLRHPAVDLLLRRRLPRALHAVLQAHQRLDPPAHGLEDRSSTPAAPSTR